MQGGAFVLELDYTPWVTASPHLRASVAAAFARAGVVIARETGAVGTDGPPPAGFWWAPTGLHVRFVLDENAHAAEHSDQHLFHMMRVPLAEALSAVRYEQPDLPLGLQVRRQGETTWYGFRPADSPADIRAGIGALPTYCAHAQQDRASGSHGWERCEGRWLPLS